MFTQNYDADTDGSFRLDTLMISPAELVKAFGAPGLIGGVEDKISGEYIFTDAAGRLYTLYDYKKTCLYQAGLSSAPDFWASKEPVEFSIGGREDSNIGAFKAWIADRVTIANFSEAL